MDILTWFGVIATSLMLICMRWNAGNIGGHSGLLSLAA